MRRREGSPLWIAEAQQGAIPLRRADLGTRSALGHYDEAWLQTLLHCHPEVFPIGQIESGYGDLIPLCRELPLLFGGGRSGALDNLFVTRDGKLVLVEAKLWRNPEARREVVAQVLEYAAAVFRMSYGELESAVLKARGVSMPEASLFKIVAGYSEGVDEDEFSDALARNLQRGRAIIAVVGDGIREDIIPLADLLQSHAGHRFTFALVELTVYETPVTGVRLVVPSVLAQTVLLERGVVRIEGELPPGQRLTVVLPTSGPTKQAPSRPMGIGEDEFFELLGRRDTRFPENLNAFLAKAEAFGVYADMQGGLNLKHASPTERPLNMGTISKGGIVDTGPSTWWDRRLPGQNYNESLARLIGGKLSEEGKTGDSGLRTAAGKMPRLSDLLPQNEQAWLDAMERYIRECLAGSQAG